MIKNQNNKNLLSTWKEIASYLEIEKRTCLRWEKKYGLPIHRLDKSSKARVHAYKEELDKWRDKTFKQSKIPLKKLAYNPGSQKSVILLAISISVVLMAAFFMIITIFRRYEPVDFNISGSILIMLDKDGKELWEYETGIDNLIEKNTYRDHFQKKSPGNPGQYLPFIVIKDINSDNKKEVLFSIQTDNEINEGVLICFNNRGDLLWTYKTGRELTFEEVVNSDDYRIHGFETHDLNHDGNLEIIVISDHLIEFPTQLIVLNHLGDLLGEYWNSGQIMDFTIHDMNDDGTRELIVVGMNNEYKKGCVIIFDTDNIWGSSPQLLDHYKFKGFKPGTEKYYLLFPRTDLDISITLVEAIDSVTPLGNRRLSFFAQSSHLIYELDYELKIQQIRFTDDFVLWHRNARSEGKINSEINQEYEDKLRNGFLYYDGQKWVSQPAVNRNWER